MSHFSFNALPPVRALFHKEIQQQCNGEMTSCNGQAEHVQWYKRKALFLIPDLIMVFQVCVFGEECNF